MNKLTPLEKEKELLRMKFEEKVGGFDVNGCLKWLGHLNEDGYGVFYYDGKHILAHRYVYIKEHGEIPEGKEVCHSCNNPSCVNHKHLYLDTHKGNMGYMVKQGRSYDRRGEKNSNTELTWKIVNEMRKEYANDITVTYEDLAKKHNLSFSTVIEIINNTRWIDKEYKIPLHKSGKEGEHNSHAKLTWEKIREIREKDNNGEDIAKLAKDYGVSRRTVYRIVANKSWIDSHKP